MQFCSNEGTLEVHDLVSGRYELRQPDANGRYLIASMGLFLGFWYEGRNNKSLVTLVG